MKISLQIILADARSPGRGLPPQPFDRHISGELPNLDNIIQESESESGDSAQAGYNPITERPTGQASARGAAFRHAGSGAKAPPPGPGQFSTRSQEPGFLPQGSLSPGYLNLLQG